jgi:hypothetical protein
LARGEKVTQPEILDEYMKSESTPWGEMVGTPESIRRAAEKVAEAQRMGLLVTESDGTPDKESP